MEINQQKTVKVNAKTLRIHCKVSDRFTYAIDDEQGEEIYCQDDGYVPDFMPGEHYGKGADSWSIDHSRPISSFPMATTLA